MALHDITDIFGVTRVETLKGFVYHFPLEIIATDTKDNSMTRTDRGESNSQYVRFVDIPNKLGAGNIKGYVEVLCNKLDYRQSIKADKSTLRDGSVNTDYELTSIELLSDISKRLQAIEFLLKGIAE